jgi:hypothetical protein
MLYLLTRSSKIFGFENMVEVIMIAKVRERDGEDREEQKIGAV